MLYGSFFRLRSLSRAKFADGGLWDKPLGAQAKRFLATKAAAKKVSLPCTVYGVSGRYANALYMTAAKANALKQVEGDMAVFKEAYNTNVSFKRYILDPSIARKTKAGVMLDIMKDSSEVTRKFVGESEPGKYGPRSARAWHPQE